MVTSRAMSGVGSIVPVEKTLRPSSRWPYCPHSYCQRMIEALSDGDPSNPKKRPNGQMDPNHPEFSLTGAGGSQGSP